MKAVLAAVVACCIVGFAGGFAAASSATKAWHPVDISCHSGDCRGRGFVLRYADGSIVSCRCNLDGCEKSGASCHSI